MSAEFFRSRGALRRREVRSHYGASYFVIDRELAAGRIRCKRVENRFTPVREVALDLDEIFRDGPLRMLEFGRRALNWAEDWAPSGSAKNKAKKKLEDPENQGLAKKKGSAWDIIRS